MPPETYESNDARLVRRNPWILGLCASPILLTIAALVASVAVQPGYAAFAFHPTIGALLLLAWAWAQNPRSILEQVPVRANAGGIRVGARFVPRSEIRSGLVVPANDDKPTRVTLGRKRGMPLEIAVAGAPEGRRLLHALGLDASQSVATFRTISRAMARPRNVFLSFLGLLPFVLSIAIGSRIGHASPAVMTAIAAASVTGFLSTLLVFVMPTRVDIGADGLVLSWFWRKRFIPYGEIESVVPFATNWGRSSIEGISITLSSGEEVKIGFNKSALTPGQSPILEERILEAMDTWQKGGAESDAALLARGDRGVSEWVAALRSIGTGANAGPRTAPVPPERLWRIVEDPRAEGQARAAAAVALGADLDEGGRARLRAAAEATAAPRLRIAIEAAASPDGAAAEVDAALAEVAAEAEEHARRRRAS